MPLRRNIFHDAETLQVEKFQNDPYWRDLLLFYEYYNGENGTGIGASHQTGWTGLAANLLHQSGEYHQQTTTDKLSIFPR